MCGITALYAYGGGCVERAELERIRDHMTPRGPDGSGAWYGEDDAVALGHRRLSIIDLSEAGAQPMQSQDGNVVVCFNGEIYNHEALRAGLIRKGYHFVSGSDTEVLLHLYADRGEEMVHDLRGMYAFALWDARKRALLIARDPLGIKPLYYADDGRVFRLASQVKALVAGGRVDTRPEPAGHVGFFLWGHVPEPYTLFRGIRALPAGSVLWVDDRGPRAPRKFADLTQALREAEADPVRDAETKEYLREALVDTVRHHLVADVEVGVFLSSGLDSTTLAALTAEVGGQLRTVSLGFSEYRGTENDEVPLAEQVAQRYGARHHTAWVERHHFRQEHERVLAAMDQPSIDGVNSYFVSKVAAEAGLKVALSGLGGDELFGGYPSFREIPRLVAWLGFLPAPHVLGRGFRVVSAPVLKHFTSPKYAGLLEYGTDYAGAYILRRGLYMPWELPKLLDGELLKEGWQALSTRKRLERAARGIETARFRVSALESIWYMRNQLLRDTDWASMAHSLEVRVPLVDWTLVKQAARLLAARPGVGKRDMGMVPREALPGRILNRKKTGFSVPVRDWLLSDQGAAGAERGLRAWARHVYASQAAIK